MRLTLPGVAVPPTRSATNSQSRVLWLSCLAHAMHDGYTDMTYVLLPVWQVEFGLSYGALALLRGIYAGAMASLQLPAGHLTRRLGARITLALGTLLAAAGYALAGLSGSLLGLCVALGLSGSGSSTQHPIASSEVSRAYKPNARRALSIYNFSGDIGKSVLPAALSLLVTVMPLRHALWIAALLGAAVAGVLAVWLPRTSNSEIAPVEALDRQPATRLGAGFMMLFLIGILDTAVRMGLLTFLPFLLKEKGASMPVVGTALAVLFMGGAAGKFFCGWLGARIGVSGTVLATEGATAACIVAVMFLPLPLTFVVLPLLGVVLNGTSSVLYGTVPELISSERTERAFAIFYTGTMGAGATAPIIYGLLGDHVGVHGATVATALTAVAILPLAIGLRSHLQDR